MRTKRKILIFLFLVIFGAGGGYLYLKKYQAEKGGYESIGKNGLEQKRGDTSLSGTLIEQNGEYFISQSTGQPTGLDSYDIKLRQYVGKDVTVKGQYSGDTLFVSHVEVN